MMIPKSLLRWHSSQWEGGNERAILTISKHSTRKRDIPTFWRQMARVNQPISSTLSAQTVCCAELYGMSASPPKASWESWRSLCRWKTGVSRRASSVPSLQLFLWWDTKCAGLRCFIPAQDDLQHHDVQMLPACVAHPGLSWSVPDAPPQPSFSTPLSWSRQRNISN